MKRIAKKIVNVILAVLIISIKLFIVAPVYLLVAPVKTALSWGGMKYLKLSISFEARCVYHTLRDDCLEISKYGIYPL